MKIFSTFFFVLYLSVVACKNKTPEAQGNKLSESAYITDTIHKVQGSSNQKDEQSDKEYEEKLRWDSMHYLLIQRSEIKIISLQYQSDSDTVSTGDNVKNECEKWGKLNQTDIASILKRSVPITNHEWHYAYEVYPCNMKGKALIGDCEVMFSVHAGAYSYVEFPDGLLLMGYLKKDYRKYFIEGPWMPENE